jgi:hypothetical protein
MPVSVDISIFQLQFHAFAIVGDEGGDAVVCGVEVGWDWIGIEVR